MQRPFTFTPLIEFPWIVGGVTIGHYVPGLTYTVREGETYDDLATKVDVWLKDGKVVLGIAGAKVEGN